MIILSNFIERLKDLMEEKQLTIKEVAQKTGVSRPTVNKYLLSQQIPSVSAAVKLADLFECSIDYLLGRTENYSQNFYPCPPFAEQLRNLLKEFQTTQYRLYTYGHIPQSAVQNWMKGTHTPSLDNVVKMAEFFDCTTDFILGRER